MKVSKKREYFLRVFDAETELLLDLGAVRVGEVHDPAVEHPAEIVRERGRRTVPGLLVEVAPEFVVLRSDADDEQEEEEQENARGPPAGPTRRPHSRYYRAQTTNLPPSPKTQELRPSNVHRDFFYFYFFVLF